MRKLTDIFMAAAVFLGVLCFASYCHAFILMKLIKGPTVLPMPDFPGEAIAVGSGLIDLAHTGQKTYNATQNNINNARNAINATFNFDFKSLMDGTQNPGQMEIVSCEVGDIKADVYDPDSIEEAIYKLFYEYPSYEKYQTDKYDDYRSRFYEDSVIELYTASRQLMIYMDEVVKPTLEEAQQCLKEGGCGLPAPDAASESSYSEAQALESIDNLLMVLQKAVALRAQLRAVQAINSIEAKPYSRDEEESDDGANLSSLDRRPPLQLASRSTVSGLEPLAFAQVMPASNSAAAVSSIAEVERVATGIPDDEMQLSLERAMAFTEPPESDRFHAFGTDSTKEKIIELDKLEPVGVDVDDAADAHNTVRGLKSYRDSAREYQKTVERHKRAVAALKKSDDAVIIYLSRRFANPEIVWSGRILGDNVADYDLRRGISAWVIQAFEAAKAAHVPSTSSQDIAQSRVDLDEKNINNTDDLEEVYDEFGEQKSFASGPGKEEQMEKENREIALIPWQVGAEGAKLLAQSTTDWGGAGVEFPVWTDTKSYYGQYIEGKYANIRSYLKRFSVNDIKALLIAQLSGTAKQAAETLKQKEYTKLDEKLTAERLRLLEAKHTEEKEVLQAIAAQRQRRKAFIAQIDAVAQRYKALTDHISDLRQKAQDDAVDSQHQTVTYYDSYTNYDSDLGIDKEAGTVRPDPELEPKRAKNQEIAEASAALATPDDMRDDITVNKTANKKKADIAGLEKQADALNQQIERMKKELAVLEIEIKNEILDLQKKSAEINAKYAAKFAQFAGKLSEAKNKLDADYGKDADSYLNKRADGIVAAAKAAFAAKYPKDKFPLMSYDGPSSADLMASLTKSVSGSLEQFYSLVDQRIDAALEEYKLMRDGLYYPMNHDKVVKIHNDMMNDIKLLLLTVNNKGMDIAASIYLYADLLPADTAPETEDYFVGSPAKARDLKAPKKVMAFNLPPLREIVHFDEIDFQNVKPYLADRELSEPFFDQEFLEYGGEIPEIWKLMLKDFSYVETDFKLQPALIRGCTMVSFFRGGYMPCKAIKSNAIIDVNDKGKFIRGKPGNTLLTECPALEGRGMGVYSTQREVNILFGIGDAEDVACPYSELGSLMAADDNNTLMFHQRVYDAFHKVIAEQIKLDANEEISANEHKELAPLDAAPLSTNQFGDFLNYVENEQIARKSMEQTKQSYDEAMENLKAVLARFGFEPSPDFDIGSDKDYEMVRGKLMTYKNKKIKEALEKIEKIDVADNEVVEERVEKYKKIIAALQKDKDILTIITPVVVDNNHLDEDIKSTKVNEEVSGKYEEHVDKNITGKIDLSANPYCANY